MAAYAGLHDGASIRRAKDAMRLVKPANLGPLFMTM
jgi:hypothetical protein